MNGSSQFVTFGNRKVPSKDAVAFHGEVYLAPEALSFKTQSVWRAICQGA